MRDLGQRIQDSGYTMGREEGDDSGCKMHDSGWGREEGEDSGYMIQDAGSKIEEMPTAKSNSVE